MAIGGDTSNIHPLKGNRTKPEKQLGCLPTIIASLVLWALFTAPILLAYQVWITGAYQ